MRKLGAGRRTSNSYLHHKFLIRDPLIMWTESGNFTSNALVLCGSEWDDGWNISGDCVPCLRNKCKYRKLNSIGF